MDFTTCKELECQLIIATKKDSIFNNVTIIDGELCNNNFIIHDGVTVEGVRINKMNHDIRLSIIEKCLKENIINTEIVTDISVSVKQFYKYQDLTKFIDIEYKNNKLNDGIIFMPIDLPVMSGTQFSMFKWKPFHKHTFDFLIKETDENINSLEAYVYHLKSITLFAKIHNSTEVGKLFINKTKKLDNYKNECILECEYSDKNFIPLLIRTDKTHPNSLRTIEKTLFNINEDIKLNDFM